MTSTNAIENLKLVGSSARKAPLGIVPMHGLVGVSRVLEDSGVKYSPGNFMAQSVGDAVESYDSAQLRHRLQCTPLSGLVTPATYAALDDDSGLPHIDHMLAGLLILRTLMIRDGMLPEDPGIGKRKQAASAPKISNPSDPGYRYAYQPLPVPSTAEDRPMPSTVDGPFAELRDPDAARRAAAEDSLRKLEAEQRAATEAKAQRDRDVAMNGRARAEGMRL